MTNIWAIILNYNGKDFLNKSIASLLDSQSEDFSLTVLIVDNNSSDSSFKKAQIKFAQYDNIKFAQNDSNLGFGAGNNIGIRQALDNGAEFAFLLNNDATVQTDTLAKLLQTAQNQTSPSVLCPIIKNSAGEIWYAGGKIDWWRMRTSHLTTAPKNKKVYPTGFATGAALLIDARVFAQIGLWDEAYFLYYEDADFSARALLAGCFVGVVPTACATHHEASARTEFSATKTYWLVRSGARFFATHSPGNEFVSLFLRKIWHQVLIVLRKTKNKLDTILRKNKVNLAVAKAWQDNKLDKKSNYQTQITYPTCAISKTAPTPTLNIQIVYYRGLEHLRNCLLSLNQHAQFAQKIIIINHSKQDIAQIKSSLKDDFTQKIIIINQENKGFGAGHNAGAAQSKSDIILFLNPDTVLTQSIAQLLQFFADTQIAAISPQLTNPQNQPQPHCHGKYPTVSRLLLNRLLKDSHKQYTQETNWISGGAMLVRSTDFAQIGGFDENFFLYFEDVDLCLRLRQLRKKILFTPATSITHIGGTSFHNKKQQKTHYDRSQDYYFRKHHGKIQVTTARILRKIWRIMNEGGI